jgi:hypothetical protein
MLNVNRNINLATPLVKVSGKGPDILPYLNNLRMFIYYSDLASNTVLTGNTGSTFISESRWNPYYQNATISASVSGTILDTLTQASQLVYSVVSRSVSEGPYFTGSLANPPTTATNQTSTLQNFVCISGSNVLNDMSSSWSFVTYLKPDNTFNQNTFNFGNFAQSLFSKIRSDDGFCKTSAYSISPTPNTVIVTTGEPTGGGNITSASFNSPSINLADGNYHMITITVNDLSASVYIDNKLASGSFNSTGLGWTFNNGTVGNTYKDLKFGGPVSHNIIAGGSQNYRPFMGNQKAILIYNKGLNLSDVANLYSIFERDNLAPGINVDVNN